MSRPRVRRPRRPVSELLDRAQRRPPAIVTPEQRAQIDARFAQLQAFHPLSGLRAALRLGGITSAVVQGRPGSKRFGWWLHGHRGGNAVRAHRYQRASDGRSWAPYLPPRSDSADPNSAS